MAGAGLILILAGLVAPIAMIILAVVFDIALLAWLVLHSLFDRLAPVYSALVLPGKHQVHAHP